ncbi:outer membrane beta-barrel protein [Helicobacter trogontum]|uniref:Outer membrane beta-barrel protein n=1 Tax=Helicobacter trogontum TaxID=50960 RepID=A0A4U8S5Q7_9HELI|nr:outer membrane beta-barrel protein [Helicobacter trogontum]TLD81106.1 outer membrane beta-barrel protein [Helicobacter trogontum]
MKKILALGVISFSLSTALAEAKFFLGVDAGVSITNGFHGTDNGAAWGSGAFYGQGQNFQNWLVGINLGTEHLFVDDLVGFRWFLGVNYGQMYKPNAITVFIMNDIINVDNWSIFEVQLGVDALVNFIALDGISFGAFAGIAGNTSIFKPDMFKVVAAQEDLFGFSGAGVVGRLGLTMGIGEHNRIDFTTVIPIVTIDIGKDGAAYDPISFMLGYKVLF